MELLSQQQQLGVLAENFAAHERMLEAFGTTLSQLHDQLQSLITDLAWDRARLAGMHADADAVTTPAAAIETATATVRGADVATRDDVPDVPAVLAAVAAAALAIITSADAVETHPETDARGDEAAEAALSITVLEPAPLAEHATQTLLLEQTDAPADDQPTLTLAEAAEQMTSVTAFEASRIIPAIPEHTANAANRLDVSGIDLANIEALNIEPANIEPARIDASTIELPANEPAPSPDHPKAAADSTIISLAEPTPAFKVEPAAPTLDTPAPTANTNVISLTAHRKRRFSVLPRAASVAAAMLAVTVGSLLYGNDTLQAELAQHLSQISACSVAAIATNQDCAALAWLSL